MNDFRTYFLKHRTGTIIVLVVVFILAGTLIWAVFNNKNQLHYLTEQERADIIRSTTGTSPGEVLTPKEKSEILNSTSGSSKSASTTLDDQQRQQLINSMSAK